ncbi:MAG: YggT family protein [Candidatus Cloacimonetes bacterium]|nr:YggT family protein [Candidatus Cloacimonadota bacterium]
MYYSPIQVIIIFAMRLIQVYSYLILIRVIMSWVISDPYNKIYYFLVSITEPLLAPIRKLLPAMGLDLSPIIAFFLLNLVSNILSGFL